MPHTKVWYSSVVKTITSEQRRLGWPSPLKPTKVTLFTLILYNSEN